MMISFLLTDLHDLDTSSWMTPMYIHLTQMVVSPALLTMDMLLNSCIRYIDDFGILTDATFRISPQDTQLCP